MPKMSDVSASQYAAYLEQYELLIAEDPVGALESGEDAARFGIQLTVLQTAFGLGAK